MEIEVKTAAYSSSVNKKSAEELVCQKVILDAIIC